MLTCILRTSIDNTIFLKIMKQKYNHLRFYSLLLFLSFTLFVNAQTTNDSALYNQVKEIHEQLKSQYAPDQRTKLFILSQQPERQNELELLSTESEVVELFKEKVKNLDVPITYRLLPDSSVGNKLYGIVNISVANLRTRPSHAAEMATQALLGSRVDILEKNGGDYRVRTPEGYIAWVPTSSIVTMTEREYDAWKNLDKIIFTDSYGKSYANKELQGSQISDLVFGNILALMEEGEAYFKVQYPDQKTAFIEKSQSQSFDSWLTSRNPTAENLIKDAKTMLGLPYLWGGTSVKGVDCSGFTKTAFLMNGIIIPRDASQQVLEGEPIEILDENNEFSPDLALKNLRKGDLLFFAAGKNKTPNARVTHVAIYMENGEFIHSAGSVRINSMLKDADNYDDFQTRTVVAARRYLNSSSKGIFPVKTNKYY